MGSDPFVGAILAALLGLFASVAWADLRVPGDYPTIGTALAAIEGGVTSDRTVVVAPGTRSESVTLSGGLPAGVVLRGEETARTVLTGGIVVDGALDARISNFTFTGDGPAVLVSSGSATVANNVFRLSDGETAVSITAAQVTIVNNVFQRGGTAIEAGLNAVVVENNAFVSNGGTVVGAASESVISANAFFEVEAIGDRSVTGSPLFVAPDLGDFHLRADSPLIDAGNDTDTLDGTTADIGAYGGDFAEGIPFPVRGLTVVSVESDGLENSVELSWSPNRWYLLEGYRLYYDNDEGAPYEGTGADQGDSPIDAGDVTGFTLNGLAAASGADLAAPELAPPSPRDRALLLSWSRVEDASGYLVYYRAEDGDGDEVSIDVGNVTRYTLGGLDNGTNYRVRVAAYAQGAYRFAVTAYPGFDEDLEGAFSDEVTASIGPRAEGPPSNEVVDFPEAIIAFPGLPDENGCFIATAAYGFYGAGEVQLLRRFRDRYLLTHAPGRALVAWYYAHSPRWAAALNEHPALKAPVRIALLPGVALAAFLLHVPPAGQWMAVVLILASAALLARRRRKSRRADAEARA